MPTLSRDLRRGLENVVVEARDVAEDAAEKALEALAIGDREPHRSMSDEQKSLRNRLRAHGRQLGDRRDVEKGTQESYQLQVKCAYEHWHRMLFARFLAENELLLEPENDVPLSLDVVKELARERTVDWVVLAGQFAVRMLPEVFRQDDPALEVQFAPEDRKRLENLLESLPAEVFTARDSLGWTYQFWQAERKKEINASGDKIGADELPAVTQLFTEDYMVDFLLDNTLGAWHASNVLAANPELSETAKSEDDLRKAVALSGCPWAYLRLDKGEDDKWTPAAGTFDGWPRTAKELKCFDPCMGSGHFIVAIFERLVALRMDEEQLNEAKAVAAVIRDNVFGLEIDPRCTQIAAFNLALTAWRRVGYCALPRMNLACSGLAPNAKKENWVKLAGKSEPLQRGMAKLYSLFKDAPILGSLINPRANHDDLLVASFHEMQPLLEKALAHEGADDALHELAVTASGVAKAADILAGQFTLVATNVPYLGFGKQDEALQQYCSNIHPDAKADLATCFLERCIDACSRNGVVACVTPQNWLFLNDYKSVRKKLLEETQWLFAIRLGAGAFETISGEVVKAALLAIQESAPKEVETFLAADISSSVSIAEKKLELELGTFNSLSQNSQLKNPNWVVTSESLTHGRLLQQVATAYEGAKTVDIERFRHLFWELSTICEEDWWFHNSSPTGKGIISGCHYVSANRSLGSAFQKNIEVYDESGRKVVAWLCGSPCWEKMGVAVSWMSHLPASLYLGTVFDNSAAVIMPKSEENLPAIYSFIASGDYTREVRKINQKVQVAAGTLDQVPFDLAYWQRVAAEKYPNGMPKPFSSDPTQWLFGGHPKDSDDPLQVGVARLLGYRWPRQTGSNFLGCSALGLDGLEKLADMDGIVCLSATKGEDPAAERLREVLGRAYGRDWNAAVEEGLLTRAGFTGRTLTDWLRDGFFEQHCVLFHQRPFIWHIWDGASDGFHALVNYHKLTEPGGRGRKTLEKLAYSYLGDWITRQKAEQKQGKEGADAKVAAAIVLQEVLKEILRGEEPYDLFVRWKPLHEQPIGWEPDIDDGVRMNIRPFTLAKSLSGRSIFRKAPRIKWEKADRGTEPERLKRHFPWLWGWDKQTKDFVGGRNFDGVRWNDLHYSTEAKQIARAAWRNP